MKLGVVRLELIFAIIIKTSIAFIIFPSAHHSVRLFHTPWRPDSWTSFPLVQSPEYVDKERLNDVLSELENQMPLVFPWEITSLQSRLSNISQGKGFLLMGGDCAESFDEFSVEHVQGTFETLQQMACSIAIGNGHPVTIIGRMAGQFAKPRSEPMEYKKNMGLPSYRGDIINGEEFSESARSPDPQRMLVAYRQSLQTMNLLRALQQNAEHHSQYSLNLLLGTLRRFSNPQYRPFKKLLEELSSLSSPLLDSSPFYTGHECLLLPYEQAFAECDAKSSQWVDTSAHFLWAGERTRQLNNAHVHFLSGLANPVGVKISEKVTPEELISLVKLLNPTNLEGKIVLIIRMGANKVKQYLPNLIQKVKIAGLSVIWCSDPVHSNTIRSSNGLKTRPFQQIQDELRAFFDVHAQMNTHVGGIHLELTGKHVTECIGGSLGDAVTHDTLATNYLTRCDPRLNGNQAVELAMLVAEHLRKLRGCNPLVEMPAM